MKLVKRIVGMCLMLVMLCVAASACADKITLGNDVVANTTPFGPAFPGNVQYQLKAGMVLDYVGEFDGWQIIRWDGEYGTLYVESGLHMKSVSKVNPTEAVVVAEKAYLYTAPSSARKYREGILREGDKLMVIGDKVEEHGGVVYYPVLWDVDGITVERYVTVDSVRITLR